MPHTNQIEGDIARKEKPVRYYLHRYPNIVAHIICESLGYATPTTAAYLIKDYREGRENCCEWVYTLYKSNPKTPIERAIKFRHSHTGFMRSFPNAKAITREAIENNKEPLLASWF